MIAETEKGSFLISVTRGIIGVEPKFARWWEWLRFQIPHIEPDTQISLLPANSPPV
jgi:hypothetical protein